MINFPTYTQQDVDAVMFMDTFDRDKLKQEINACDPHQVFTPAGDSNNSHKRKIICPNCGNGSGKSHTPVEVVNKDGVWLYHCFSQNDLEGDLLKIIATENNLNLHDGEDMCKALAIGAHIIGYALPATPITNEYLNLVLADIKKAQLNLINLPEDQRRGLTMHTMNNFGFGYLSDWVHPVNRIKGENVPPSRRIIIPTPHHYNAVLLPADRKNTPKKMWKMHTKPKELFNEPALTDDNELVLVVEGEIDAASIWQSFDSGSEKISVVATLGVTGWQNTLLPLLKRVKKKKFLVLFDAEKSSRTQAQTLCEELIRRGHPATCRFYYDALLKTLTSNEKVPFNFEDKIDANQILLESDEYFLRTLTEKIIDDARPELAEVKERLKSNPPAPMDAEVAPEDESRKSKRKKFLARLEELKSLPATAENVAEIQRIILRLVKRNKDQFGRPTSIKGTNENLSLIFTYDPNIRGLVGYDEFADTNALLKTPPWKHAGDMEWSDKDAAQLRLYLRNNYDELNCRQLIEDKIVELTLNNSFNPVKNFFKNLPPWDGTPRAETLFIDFLRVPDTPFSREVTLNWLTAAVARIFHPGCRYQTALVLHGNQKIGKSYIAEQLGGQWYLDLTENVDDTHAEDAVTKGWIVEIKEMSVMRKAEINAVKAFIERRSDSRRRAYERHSRTVQRHCVFLISVNDSEFLRDTTGNRRYLILHSESPKFGYIEGLTDEYIRQVWAEVYHHYNELFADGFKEKKLSLSGAAEIEAEDVAGKFLQDDGMEGEIRGYLDRKIPPQIIWNLLSREERRKFFVDGGKIEIEAGDIQARFKSSAGNKADELQLEFDKACEVKDGCVRNCAGKDGKFYFVFYGTELRQHICAAEIFNECFGTDSRKRMTRINEILSNLGWKLGKRIRNDDTVYRDQKKPFWRT